MLPSSPRRGDPCRSCGAAEVVLFGEAHEREPGVKERWLLPQRPAEPPGPRRRLRERCRGLSAGGTWGAPHPASPTVPKGLMTYLHLTQCFKGEVKAAGGFGDIPVISHEINLVRYLCCRRLNLKQVAEVLTLLPPAELLQPSEKRDLAITK